MDAAQVRKLLARVKRGSLSMDEAVERLRHMPVAEMGYATLDTHRALRQGFPEVVLGEGKAPEHLLGIVHELARGSSPVLVTRLAADQAEPLALAFPEGEYHLLARCFVIRRKMRRLGRVAVLTAGTSDIPVAEEAAITAEVLGAQVGRVFDVGVAGIHRLLRRRADIDGAKAVVVAAGMEGALASAVGGLVAVPVVAVPTSVGYGASFGGLAAMLGMLNACSPNVAVVNIDNGFGAGFYAALIARGAR